MLIVTPTYNHSEGLVNLLEICPQSQKIYVFDNSTNEIIKSICEKYENVKYFYSKKTSAIKNWNYAISTTKDNFILFLHDDEYINQNDLKKLIQLQKDKETIYYFKNSVFKNKKKIKTGLNPKLKIFLLNKFPKLILFFNFIGPTGSFIFYNNSTILKTFDEKLVWLVDTDFFYRIFQKKNYSFIKININTHLKKNSITSKLGFNKRFLEFRESMYLKKKYQINLLQYLLYILFSFFLRILNKILF